MLAIGPGLGTGDWARRLWASARSVTGIPAVVDADALNLLAASPVKLPADWIITPHPGEAARLLGVEMRAVQADRLGRGARAACALRRRRGAEGRGHAGGASRRIDLAICDRGNPGMATAGMGDVLTGVIAGLRAQSVGRGGGGAYRRAGARARGGFGGAGRSARAHRERCHRRIARLGESVTAHEPGAWITRSGEETEALGARLLGTAAPRDADCRVVFLRGELGSGKSTFARGVLRALGVTGPIKSPSYTLLETYELPAITAVHLDLYRLEDPEELEHLGLADYHRPGSCGSSNGRNVASGRLPRGGAGAAVFHRLGRSSNRED